MLTNKYYVASGVFFALGLCALKSIDTLSYFFPTKSFLFNKFSPYHYLVGSVVLSLALALFIKGRNKKESSDKEIETPMNLTALKIQVQELGRLIESYSPLQVLANSIENVGMANVFQGSNIAQLGCLVVLRDIQCKYKVQGVGGDGCADLRESYLKALNETIKALCSLELKNVTSVAINLGLDEKQIERPGKLMIDSSSISVLKRSRSCPNLTGEENIDDELFLD